MTIADQTHHWQKALAEMKANDTLSNVKFNESLSSFTSYRVGGNAAALVTVADRQELAALLHALGKQDDLANVEVAIIGRGSNLLVSDDGFAGVAVMLGCDFSAISIVEQSVLAGGAAKMPVVARSTVNAQLSGFEWAVGIPGSVGGAVRMNAGGHGAEVKDNLDSAEIADLATGEISWRSNNDLDFDYRSSALKSTELVLTACFVLDIDERHLGPSRMQEIIKWRRENQPGGQNAGSVFTNPPNGSAARLIEAVGGKGLRCGTAQISLKHANFISVDRNGCASDILALMNEVQMRVMDTHGVKLTFETHLLGFDDRPKD